MKTFKFLVTLITTSLLIYACGSSSTIKENSKNKVQDEKPVVIANDSLEYEIIIIDIGFNNFLNSVAQPRRFYSQQFLEARNRVWVNIWNQRAMNPQQYNPSIYENIINYEMNIDYGYEVNYLLYNYFIFAQQKYNMTLGGGFRPSRIN